MTARSPREPYTHNGIRRLKCYRCKKRRAVHQWQCCADGNTWRPLCLVCDIALNKLVLQWVGDPEWQSKLKAYKEREEKRWPEDAGS